MTDKSLVPMTKAMMPVKAQPLEGDELTAWLTGRIPRRILSIPFGGPIPSAKSKLGVDLDDEWFDEDTDIFGPHRALRATRERLADWHHAARPPGPAYGDPTGMMAGHVLGKSILDPDPDEDGWWSDFWFEQGNKRVELVADLVRRKGATLFGSSQPAVGVVKADGHIRVWPHLIQTITTSPQNTYSVLRPKAALDVLRAEPNAFWSDIESAMRSLGASLRESSADRALIEAKAGRVLSATNESDLREALDAFEQALGRVRSVLSRQPEYTREQEDPETP